MSTGNEIIEGKLAAYVDGELDEAGRAEIEKHLAANPQHRQMLAQLAKLRDMTRSLPRATAPPDVIEVLGPQLERSALLDDIDAESEALELRINRWPQIRALAAVLVLSLGLAGAVYLVLPSPNSSPDIHTVFNNLPDATTPPAGPVPDDGALVPNNPNPLKKEVPDPRTLATVTPETLPPESVTPASKAGPGAGEPSRRPEIAVAPSPPLIDGGTAFNAVPPRDQVLVDAVQMKQKQDAAEGLSLKNTTEYLVVSTERPADVTSHLTTYLRDNQIEWQAVPETRVGPGGFGGPGGGFGGGGMGGGGGGGGGVGGGFGLKDGKPAPIASKSAAKSADAKIETKSIESAPAADQAPTTQQQALAANTPSQREQQPAQVAQPTQGDTQAQFGTQSQGGSQTQAGSRMQQQAQQMRQGYPGQLQYGRGRIDEDGNIASKPLDRSIPRSQQMYVARNLTRGQAKDLKTSLDGYRVKSSVVESLDRAAPQAQEFDRAPAAGARANDSLASNGSAMTSQNGALRRPSTSPAASVAEAKSNNETNVPATETPATQPVAAGETRSAQALQAGSEIVVEVGGIAGVDTDRRHRLKVGEDGMIEVPLAGQVLAGGFTPEQVGKDIENRLRELKVSPSANVTVNALPNKEVAAAPAAPAGPATMPSTLPVVAAAPTTGPGPESDRVDVVIVLQDTQAEPQQPAEQPNQAAQPSQQTAPEATPATRPETQLQQP